jgi:uncharacterized protein (TIGR02646 family)
MIHVDPVEPQDVRWTQWREEATEATNQLKETGGALPISERLYKACRDLILERFHGKCAYCESKVVADQRQGDVEHFRPKGRVTDEEWQIVYVDDQKQVKHPGYYWLAYDWHNLFPSCIACNQASSNPDGTRSGKVDRFPVEGERAVKPDDKLESENALLIDPYVDDPAAHLEFDPETGIVGGKTERGRKTIAILGLNRDGLKEFRKLIAEAAGNEYNNYVDALKANRRGEIEERKKKYEIYETGEAVFSAIGKENIRQIRERLRAGL